MINFKFLSEALPEDTFEVLNFDGDEEVSQLFHVELRLVSRDPDIDFDLILGKAASLAIVTEGKKRQIHGMLAEFEQGGQWQNGLYEYRALLVPRLWMLSQSTQNQIFQNQSVIDIVESELKNVNKKSSGEAHPLVELGIGSDADYDIHTIRQYDDREYVVQYKETDLNFISRLMEHDGIYYFFEHGDICEKLVVTDDFATDEILNDSQAVFQSEASGVRYDKPVVYKLSRTQKQIPFNVLVKDFNYREPLLPMQAMGDVAANGIGFVTEFGAHFKSPEEGEQLAEIRAQEHKCRQNVFNGESNIADFNCGHIYSLSQHFRSDYNQSYMLTRVKHQGSQEIESWGNIGSTKYSNQFSCIPAHLPFRPQRLAQKPKLFGIMNGIIDSEQDLGRADLDEQGRYKVQMPFDISGVAAGMASRRIRMAQPYGGSGDDGGGIGMSFPLLKGTEVIWTCIDGDIDRPIITGAVPNPLKPSVTNTQNANSNVIKTSSGITMGFHDGTGSGASQNTTGGGAAGAVLSSQQQFQSASPEIQSPQVNENKIPETSVDGVELTLPKNTSSQSINLQQQQVSVSGGMSANLGGSSEAGADLWSGPGKRWMVKVPNYHDITDSQDSFLRLGKASTKELEAGGGWETNGWLDYTDGDHNSITKGNRTDYTDGTHTVKNKNSYSYKLAASTSYAMTAENSHSIGLKTSSALGASVSSSAGINVAFKTSVDFSFSTAATFSYALGPKFTSASDINMEADKTVSIKVDPDDTPSEKMLEETIPNCAVGIAAASSALTALIALGGKYDGGEGWNRVADVHGVLLVASGALAAGKALSVMQANKKNKTEDKPATSIDMDAKSVNIQANGGNANSEGFIALKASKEFDDAKASKIEIKKNGEVANIIIDATGGDSSGDITLTVGESSIKIQDKKMVFTSDEFEFVHSDGSKLTINKTKGMVLSAGGFVLKDGSVKASLVTKGKDIKGKKCTIGGLSVK